MMTDGIKVDVLRHPEDADWERCKMLAMSTIGKKDWSGSVTDVWKQKILRSEHSPIRTLMFTIRIEMPYWVSVHFCRHKHGVEHYVSSQRNDRQNKYDRAEAPQGVFVSHIMDVNAQGLMNMAGMRLCGQASPETREVMGAIVREVLKTNPEFGGLLVPKCVKRGGCNEFVPCGMFDRKKTDYA